MGIETSCFDISAGCSLNFAMIGRVRIKTLILLPLCLLILGCALDEEVKMSGGWEEPVPLSINTSGWEDSASITPDGRTLYFAYSDFDFLTYVITGKKVKTGPARGKEIADIMVSRRVDNAWSAPELVPVNERYALNDGFCTRDGRTAYMSGLRSENIGGAGKSDIYSVRSKNGVWQTPVNIGTPVNTRYSESNPAISDDGDLLLFESDRPGGLGSADIWASTRRDGKWTEPVNLGSPVNTREEDGQPFLFGDTLYYSGNRGKGRAILSSRRAGEKWGQPEIIVTGIVGEPSLTRDGTLYFVRIKSSGKGYDADIMMAKRAQ